MPRGHVDIVVAGGGAVGLSIAWNLARAGAEVAVIEPGLRGQATPAAAGMLAPLAEAAKPGPFVDLGMSGLRRYPDFLAALNHDCGRTLELEGPGMLRAALSEAQERDLLEAFAWQKKAGFEVEWMDGRAARDLEPAFSQEVRAAVLSIREQHIDPCALLAALTEACLRRKVRMESAAVSGFETDGSRVTAVKTAGRTLDCGKVVLAAGAWSALLARHLGFELPLFPVRGQILELRCRPLPLRHTIYIHGGYLVPRAPGRLIVGATAEKAGFDCRTTPEALAGLSAMAQNLAPRLAEFSVETFYAGLRPASGDGLPVLGVLPGWDNAYIAAGHFRNGILLAPVTGECMAAEILGSASPIDLKPFSPARWAVAAALS